jgi:hypothetical protein
MGSGKSWYIMQAQLAVRMGFRDHGSLGFQEQDEEHDNEI